MTSPASKLRYPLKRVFEEAEERDIKLTKTGVNKILYITKQQLSEDNKYYDDILCFWYLHGGMAVDSHIALNQMSGSNAIQREGNLYFNNQNDGVKADSSDEDENELTEAINFALDEYDVYSEDKIRNLYEKYAPHEFMITFRHDVLSKAEKLSKKKKRKRFLPWVDNLEEEREELRDKLLKAESQLPMDGEFREFNNIFSQFVGLSNYFLDTEPSRKEFNFYYTVCEEIWALFACKIRITEHDEEIDIEEQGWDSDYEEQLSDTKTYIEALENTVREYETDNSYESGEVWSKMVETIR